MFSENRIKSLYIHIPFCISKCSYCDFFSMPGKDREMKEAVTDSTIRQIKYFSQKYSFKHLETVYIGGGTPTSLPYDILEKLITGTVKVIPSEIKEFSIEINPETVNHDLINLIENSPLTRLSIGIQSFSGRFLKTLGRNSSPLKNINAIELLSKTGKDLNLDLISSIPGQSVGEGICDAKTASDFSPSHISLYNLTVEKNTAFSKKYSENDIDDEVWIKTSEFLEDSGYSNYEISNFSLPGKECIHNLNYWKMQNYLGVGPASVSTISENSSFVRIFNTEKIESYLEGENSSWNIRKERIDKTDYLIEYLMMGFRTAEGINITAAESVLGYNIYSIIPETVIKWDDKGFIDSLEGRLSLTRKGRLFHSSFIIDIMNELDNRKLPLS